MGDTLLQRTINSAREFVTGKPAKKKKPQASDFPMMPLMNRQQAAQSDVADYDKAMGKGALRSEVTSGHDAITLGPGAVLPRGDAKSGLTKGGFSNVMMDGAGQPIGPARTYATPATHWAPSKAMHRETYLSSQYDFRKSRGELLPPFDEWLAAQGPDQKKPLEQQLWRPPMRGDLRRLDGNVKGPGFMGTVKHKSGGHMTELSVGLPGTEEGFRPLLGPWLSQKEITTLQSGGKATPAMYRKAEKAERKRKEKGEPAFAPPGYSAGPRVGTKK